MLVRRILQYNPSSRPSTTDILADNWLTTKRSTIPRQGARLKWNTEVSIIASSLFIPFSIYSVLSYLRCVCLLHSIYASSTSHLPVFYFPCTRLLHSVYSYSTPHLRVFYSPSTRLQLPIYSSSTLRLLLFYSPSTRLLHSIFSYSSPHLLIFYSPSTRLPLPIYASSTPHLPVFYSPSTRLLLPIYSSSTPHLPVFHSPSTRLPLPIYSFSTPQLLVFYFPSTRLLLPIYSFSTHHLLVFHSTSTRFLLPNYSYSISHLLVFYSPSTRFLLTIYSSSPFQIKTFFFCLYLRLTILYLLLVNFSISSILNLFGVLRFEYFRVSKNQCLLLVNLLLLTTIITNIYLFTVYVQSMSHLFDITYVYMSVFILSRLVKKLVRLNPTRMIQRKALINLLEQKALTRVTLPLISKLNPL